MKSIHYLSIAIKLFAIFLFLHTVRESGFLIATVFIEHRINSDISFTTLSFSFVLPIVMSIVLFLFPLTAAKSILPPEVDGTVEDINPQDFLTILICAIAIYFLFQAVSDNMYWFISYNIAQNYGQDFTGENKADILVSILEFILSGTLLLRAKFISQLVIRSAK